MRKLVLLSLVFFAVVGSASAQLSVKQNGRIQVGPFKAQYDRPPLDSLLIGFSLNPNTDATASDPLTRSVGQVEIDNGAAMTVIGKLNNNSGGYIAFGNKRNVTVGEWAGHVDSDVLQLRGTHGIRYESENGEIFRHNYGTDKLKFIFNCDVKGPSFLVNSDERLKSDIEELDGSLADILGITPISYRLKPTSSVARTVSETDDGCEDVVGPVDPDPRTRYGFSAQEVKEIFPELVCEDEDGFLSVDYIGFIPVLVNAVKDLSEEVREQKEIIESLTARKDAPKNTSKNVGIDYLDIERASLSQNRPNPFTASTRIDCTLPENIAQASLRIYDLQGKQVMSLAVEGRGNTSVTVDGSTLPAGMYIYALIADGQEIDSKRMILTD